jgi:dolichol-phosphate mannosyltransferase
MRRLASQIFYRVLGYMTGSAQDRAIANFGIYHRRAIEAGKVLILLGIWRGASFA